MHNLKSFTQKDRYGNMTSVEFFEESGVPSITVIPVYDHPGDPKGTDTVPAWLTPGENVVNAEASRIPGNQEILDKMNEEGRKIQEAQGGPIPTYASEGMIAPIERPKNYMKKELGIANFSPKEIYDKLIQRGIKPNAAIGLVSNFIKETGSTLNPASIQNEGRGPGRGLAQFEVGGRFNDLKKYAKEKDSDWRNIDTQLNFVVEELQGKRSIFGDPKFDNNKNLFTKLNEAKTPQEATKLVYENYEKPQDYLKRKENPDANIKNLTSRIDNIEPILKSIGVEEVKDKRELPENYINFLKVTNPEMDFDSFIRSIPIYENDGGFISGLLNNLFGKPSNTLSEGEQDLLFSGAMNPQNQEMLKKRREQAIKLGETNQISPTIGDPDPASTNIVPNIDMITPTMQDPDPVGDLEQIVANVNLARQKEIEKEKAIEKLKEVETFKPFTDDSVLNKIPSLGLGDEYNPTNAEGKQFDSDAIVPTPTQEELARLNAIEVAPPVMQDPDPAPIGGNIIPTMQDPDPTTPVERVRAFYNDELKRARSAGTFVKGKEGRYLKSWDNLTAEEKQDYLDGLEAKQRFVGIVPTLTPTVAETAIAEQVDDASQVEVDTTTNQLVPKVDVPPTMGDPDPAKNTLKNIANNADKITPEGEASITALLNSLENNPNEKEKVNAITNNVGGWFKNAFSDLFDGQELARMALLYAGSRAMGYNHNASLGYAAKQYLERVDSNIEARETFITKDKSLENYTTESLKEYRRTGDITKLKPKQTSLTIEKTTGDAYVRGFGRVNTVELSDGTEGIIIDGRIQKIDQTIGDSSLRWADIIEPYDKEVHSPTRLNESFAKASKNILDSVNFEKKTDERLPDDSDRTGTIAGKFLNDIMLRNGTSLNDISALQISVLRGIENYYNARKEAKETKKAMPTSVEPFLQQQIFEPLTGISQSRVMGVSSQNIKSMINNIKNGMEIKNQTDPKYNDEFKEEWFVADKAWQSLGETERGKWITRAEKKEGHSGFSLWFLNTPPEEY